MGLKNWAAASCFRIEASAVQIEIALGKVRFTHLNKKPEKWNVFLVSDEMLKVMKKKNWDFGNGIELRRFRLLNCLETGRKYRSREPWKPSWHLNQRFLTSALLTQDSIGLIPFIIKRHTLYICPYDGPDFVWNFRYVKSVQQAPNQVKLKWLHLLIPQFHQTLSIQLLKQNHLWLTSQ